MLPTKKTYKIQVRDKGQTIDEISLTISLQNPDSVLLRVVMEYEETFFPWMPKQDIVAWFRKAADLIEEAKFE